MRGIATGVGSKADIGAPPEEHDTTATHRHPLVGTGTIGLAATTSSRQSRRIYGYLDQCLCPLYLRKQTFPKTTIYVRF